MSSCHCNHSPCSCGQLQADVSPYRSVTLASRILGVDRNGRPVTLDKQPFSIPSTDADGNVALRDGSEEDSILLPHLQPLLDGRSVLIRNGRGILGVVDAVEDGSFLTFSGGSVQWSKIFPRDNAFRDGALAPATGKLVVTGCSVDGYTELGFIDTAGDYVGIGASGNASSKNFCDAESKTELAFIFGCLDGKLVKLGPSAGKVIKANSSGDAWVVEDAAPNNIVFVNVDALSKAGTGKPTNFNENFTIPNTVPDGVTAIILEAEMTIIKSNGSGGLFTVKVNSLPLIGGFASGSFISPYDTTQKTIAFPTDRILNFVGAMSYEIAGNWSSWSLTVKIRAYIP